MSGEEIVQFSRQHLLNAQLLCQMLKRTAMAKVATILAIICCLMVNARVLACGIVMPLTATLRSLLALNAFLTISPAAMPKLNINPANRVSVGLHNNSYLQTVGSGGAPHKNAF